MSSAIAAQEAADAQKRSQNRWAVVGGGMLGLTVAWRLAQRGDSVTLFEAGETIGGLTSSWQLDDVEWDKFYHVILLSDSRLRALLAEIGLEQEIRWVQTRTGFFCDGKLHSLSSSLEFLLFPPLSLLQKFRLGGTIFLGSKIRDAGALEKIPVADWLKKWSGQSVFKKIWLPLLKAKLGEAYQRTSAAFIWSYIDRMYKARRSGMKREMFGYVPGGYRRILNVLTEKLQERGVEIKTSSPVSKVFKPDSNSPLQITSGRGDDVCTDEFDQVIMTAPSPFVSKACEQLTEDEHSRLRAGEYLGVTCTSLLMDKPLAGYYVTNITDEWVPLTGIIEMGAIVKPEFLGGKYLVYLPQYMLSDDDRFNESDEEIHERCLATLEKIYPEFSRAQVQIIKTARARHVMTLPTIGYSENLPPVVSSVEGVYLLNSAQITIGNLNVNETIEIAERELENSIYPRVIAAV